MPAGGVAVITMVPVAIVLSEIVALLVLPSRMLMPRGLMVTPALSMFVIVSVEVAALAASHEAVEPAFGPAVITALRPFTIL